MDEAHNIYKIHFMSVSTDECLLYTTLPVLSVVGKYLPLKVSVLSFRIAI